MLIGPPEIQLFKKSTLKIQVQGHGWGQSSKSQCESNILSTHIPLVPCQLALPFLRYSILKIWPWKSKVEVIPQGHKVGITPYLLISFLFHVDQPSHSWDTAISIFDIENSRSMSWVRSQLKVTTWVQHSVDSHPFRSMSFPFLSYDFSKLGQMDRQTKPLIELLAKAEKSLDIHLWKPSKQMSLSGVPDYFGHNKISSGGDLSHYSSASLY